MLCLRAQVLDDSFPNKCNGNAGGGFVLPINLGNVIHKYMWRNSKTDNRSVASGDAFSSSLFSDSQDTRPPSKRNEEKHGNSRHYKYQLEQDIKQLQQKLQEEIDLRLALASAVENSDSSFSNPPCQLPDKAQELLNSVAVLEFTVSRLEEEMVALQYQLSQERNERRLAEYHLRHSPSPASSLSEESMTTTCCREEGEVKMEDEIPCLNVIKEPYEKLRHHPNLLSEEMITCMRDIFLFLAESSKLSFSSGLASPSSPQGHLSYYSWSSSIDSPLKNPSIDKEHKSLSARRYKFDPYKVPGMVDWTENIGPYSTAFEVSWFSVGKKELEYAAGALKRYRLLVEQLAVVDPSCLSCSEKMAFWINVYHALIMHAFLAYGVPRSDIKLLSLMQKAAYIVGGHSFNAVDIEYSILKMKPPAHRPQMALVLALQKFKVNEQQKKFSIDKPEPLLAFALSCGMHSSPAVQIFRPDNVNNLLEKSLKDYIQASVGISSKGKLVVPKLLYCFVKDIVDDRKLPEWICQFLAPEQAGMVRDGSGNHKSRIRGTRSFSVLPFNSRFRFLFLL